MTSELINTYICMLKYMGFYVDDSGFVLSTKSNKPCMIDNKPLALPYKDMLKRSHDERVIFHPLLEEPHKGESKVHKKIKYLLLLRINLVFTQLGLCLFKLAINQGSLSGVTLETSRRLRDTDAKTISSFTSLALNNLANCIFANIYLKRAGKVKEVKYSRAGIVTFPIIDDLSNKDHRLRYTDVLAIKGLYDVVFPEYDAKDKYNYGTNSHVAPFTVSLFYTAKKLTDALNKAIDEHEEYVVDKEDISFDNEWCRYLDNLDSLKNEIRSVPMQDGNQGTIGTDDLPVPKPAIPSKEDSAQSDTDAPVKKSKNLTLDEALDRLHNRNRGDFPTSDHRRGFPNNRLRREGRFITL